MPMNVESAQSKMDIKISEQFKTLSEAELKKVPPVSAEVLEHAFASGQQAREAVAARTQSSLMTTRTLFR